MTSPDTPRPISLTLGLRLTVFAVLAAGAASAQPAPCGPADPGNQCFDQETVGIPSDAADDELFGASLAFGDFNDDGFDDLAVGVPNELVDLGPLSLRGGFVHVLYGSADGLTAAGSLHLGQGSLPGQSSEDGDGFGFSVATGDFNRDFFDDLAIGAPFESHPGCPFGCNGSGVFHVVYGGPQGLDPSFADTFTNQLDIPGGTAADGNEFGATLVRSPRAGFDDLLVCAPGFAGEAGRCFVLFSASAGLNQGSPPQVSGTGSAAGERFARTALTGDFIGTGFLMKTFGSPRFTAPPGVDHGAIVVNGFRIELADLIGANQANARFGSALAAGDFDDDGFEDLAVGVPGRSLGSQALAGAVHVLFGEMSGLPFESHDSQTLTQNDLLGPGEVQTGDFTGAALAEGDFDGDGFPDLAIGAPGEGSADTGRVIVAFGGDGALDLGRTLAFDQAGLGGLNAVGDQLGLVFATGDVDGDGRDELAIGVPLKDVAGHADAGMVYVYSLPAPAPGAEIFADGFESGSTSAWSAAVP